MDDSVLVTGATGMVGRELVPLLLDGGAGVRIFRRKESPMDALQPIRQQIEEAVGDVTDPISLHEAMEGIDTVIHAAALIPGNDTSPENLHAVNVQGTANVVNAALEAEVGQLLHVSSIGALGRPTDETIDEETTWLSTRKRSDYAQSKRNAELEVYRGIAEGLPAVIVNPAMIFGAGRPGDNTRRIAEFIDKGWLVASPPGATCFVDARDVAEGALRALRLGESGERYLLGGENLTWHEALSILAERMGRRPPTVKLPTAVIKGGAAASEALAWVTRGSPLLPASVARSMSSRYRYSNRKARVELGCSFRPFAETADYVARAVQSGS